MGLHLRRAAVLGRPIGHSLSPVLHRAAYAALDLPGWRYDALDCGVDELPALLAGAGGEWAGFSCTLPLKQVALAAAAEVRPLAALVGAANTLLPVAGGWAADNTDVLGITGALAERGVRPGIAAILGAGGTAQAAVVALARMGVVSCRVVVRSAPRAAALLDTASRAGVRVDLAGVGAPLEDCDLVISTLPAGVGDPHAARPWSGGTALLDAVYAPWPTALASAVAASGGTVLGGALMLLHQAAAQVELMTGRAAPVEAMRTALRAALRAASPGADL